MVSEKELDLNVKQDIIDRFPGILEYPQRIPSLKFYILTLINNGFLKNNKDIIKLRREHEARIYRTWKNGF